MSHPNVVPFESEHLEAIAMIDRESFDDLGWSIDEFADPLEQCQAAVYLSPSQGVIGYVLFFVEQGKRIEIIRFAVDPRSRRLGLGSLLIRHCLNAAIAADCSRVICDIPAEGSLGGMPMLRKLGFAFDSKVHIGDDDDIDSYRFVAQVEALKICPTSDE